MLNGADLVSTWVAKQWGAYRGSEDLVNPTEKVIVANDENYALAA
jgi:ribosome biogenesis GTPase A